MKALLKIILATLITFNISIALADHQTNDNSILPDGETERTTDNWTDGFYWTGNAPGIAGGRPPSLNNKTVNIGNSDTPAHYILRIGDLGGGNNINSLVINVYPNATLKVNGTIHIGNEFTLNIFDGGTFILDGNLQFHNDGTLVVNGDAVITGNINSHNNSGTLEGDGNLYVGGNIGLGNLDETNVTVVNDGNVTDLSIPAPVLSAVVFSGPEVHLSWVHDQSSFDGYEFVGYQVYRDWDEDNIAGPYDNLISNYNSQTTRNYTDDFSDTDYNLEQSPIYYVRAVFHNSTEGKFKYSPISNKVEELSDVAFNLSAPVLSSSVLNGTEFGVKLNWTYEKEVIPGYVFYGFQLFKNSDLLVFVEGELAEYIDKSVELGDRPVYNMRAVYRDQDGLKSDEYKYTPFSNTEDYTDNPLPIELLHFSAKAEGQSVTIQWATAAEINNDFFTLERSMDGNNWEVVTYVYGAGNSNYVINYEYTDEFPLEGISYYRLKQTDFDGQFEYFSPVAVYFSHLTSNTEIVNVRSNRNSLYIQYTNETPGATMVVADIRGRILGNFNVQAADFVQDVTIDLPGNYTGEVVMIRLVASGSSDERKLVIR